jgi:glyoxylase-like metal-dependent hydrolase (beta-lactamase superfamily II)
MTQITFYPLGCADTSLVELRDGRRMLVDYANKHTGSLGDKCCDLPKLLKADLKAARRSAYSVVAFTHLDDDHCTGASDFFYLEWAAKY